MKRTRATRLLTVCLLALAVAGGASAQTAPPTLGALVEQVLARFPKIDTDVLEVRGAEVTVAAGRRDGLAAGVELFAYRQGRELRHPRTGEILGRTEQDVGRVVVDQVFEAYATGRVGPGSDVRAGDRARLSSGKIPLTVLPLVDGVKDGLVEAAVNELVEALGRTERFQVGMGDAIGVALTQEGASQEDILEGRALARVGERFKLAHLLVVRFTRVQNRPYLEARLFGLPAAQPFLSTALFVPSSIRAAPKGDFSASSRARDSQTARAPRSLLARLLAGDLDAGAYSTGETNIPLREVAKFPFPIASMDVAVAPGDRVPRLVVTDGERVFLYRLVDRALEPEWTFKADARARIFGVQLAELDGDGVLEVVVNRYHPDPGILVNSLILGSQNGKPVVLGKDIDQILLAVDSTGEGVRRTLWGSGFTQRGFFRRGDASRLALQKGSLVSAGRVQVPASFRMTGATLANIAGKDTRALAYVDEFNRLRVALDGEEIWRSSSPVGSGPPKLAVETQIERGGRTFLYAREIPPLAVDLDGDGVEEVVVVQNQIPGRLAVVYKGPAGYRFQTVNSGFEGTIMGLGALPGENAPSLVAAVVRYYGLLGDSGETQLIMTTPD